MQAGDAAASSTLALSELVAARICHDLAGPAGTIAGALEVLADELARHTCAPAAAARPPPATEPGVLEAVMLDGGTLGLARDAATALAVRLRLLRAAFAASMEAAPASISLPGGAALLLDPALPLALQRAALALALDAAPSLPAAGPLRATATAEGMRLSADRPGGLNWADLLQRRGPRGAGVALVQDLAAALGWQIAAAQDALTLRTRRG